MERTYEPIHGGLSFVIWLVLTIGSLAALAANFPPGGLGFLLSIFWLKGFLSLEPNVHAVVIFLGKYKGTVKRNGFSWINPFFGKRKISVRARNFDSEPIKVNDKVGNPIMIGAVLVWRVRDTFRAMFEVDDYSHFVRVQNESALRELAGHYPYDDFEDHDAQITLRSGTAEVNDKLEAGLAARLSIAGIEVIEARISYLAYASEIASAMLQRQQATAVVAARQKIVEGAVGMVELALKDLKAKQIVDLSNDQKAQMVSNLMVVLCSERSANPIVNAGV